MHGLSVGLASMRLVELGTKVHGRVHRILPSRGRSALLCLRGLKSCQHGAGGLRMRNSG